MRETPEGVEHLRNEKRRTRAKNRETVNEKARARDIKTRLSMKLGIPVEDIPQDMFEAVTALNTVIRKIKELSK